MAKQRESLSAIFHRICPNVYFQPPGGHKLTYPCIVYSLRTLDPTYANNNVYLLDADYSVQYMTRNPDDLAIFEIARIPCCRMSSSFTSDNVHHYQYNLRY